ncbi:NTPase KAP, partial [Vibrio vulnificus]|nr:NTPase KAP [Vibrio vulnificus]
GVTLKLVVDAGDYSYSAFSGVHPTYLSFQNLVYDIEIRSLFERIHTHHFDAEFARVVCTRAKENLKATATELSEAIWGSDKQREIFIRHQGDVVSLGLKYEGVESRYSFYKDLVELSTALDV